MRARAFFSCFFFCLGVSASIAAPCLAAASAVLARARSSTRLASVWAWLFEYFCSEGFWWSIHSFHSRFEARRVAREAKPEPPGARVGACFAAA